MVGGKKSYGLRTYMIIMFIVLGVVLISIIFPILNTNVTRMEDELISSRLVADINYIEDLIGEGDWNIKGDAICRGDVVVGDGTLENANLRPFLEHEEKTGTFAYVFERCSDEGLTYVEDTPTQAGYQQGHFLRVAGSTKDPNGNSIVGTYMDKKVADILDAEDVYDGEANVAGGMIYCRYETLKDQDGSVVGAIVVGRGIEELRAQVSRTTKAVILAGVLAIIIVCILLYLLINRWVRAMHRSTRFLQAIESGNIPEERLMPQGYKEVDILNQGINSLADTLTENRKLRIMSETDQLTGLANRFGMDDHGGDMLKEAAREGKPLSVGIIDIDYFKNYNDYYGHQKGDECIITIADVIRTVEEPGKVLAARFGGDEFVVMTCGLEKEEVERIAERIHDGVMQRKIIHEDSETGTIVTVTQGYFVSVPRSGQTMADYIRIADSVMYEVKSGEKSGYMISSAELDTSDGDSENSHQSKSNSIDWNTYHDYLTRLLNQEGFFREVSRILNDNPEEEYYMISSNILDFKLVNQFFGYEKGNEILIQTAEILRSGKINVEVAGRLHGDRFAFMISKKNYNEDILRECFLEQRQKIEDSEFMLQYQLGVYLIQDRSMDISFMCDRANIAISSLESESQNAIAYYDSSMMDNILRENTVITEFENALESGMFKVYLQPIVTNNKKVVGAEALVRWIRDDGEIVVSPADFIETLEKSGKIYKLDSYVWEEAARIIKSWKGTPMENLFISVNVSPYDINYLNIEQVFEDLTKRYDIRPDQLNPEFTESTLISDTKRYIDLISSLQKKGFHVEIDDFGTGYSSLNILKYIHADVLKIDKDFVQTTESAEFTENRQRNRRILASIIEMSAKLGMAVIAEGVETEAQFQFLSAANCNLFQGFYFSKPVPVSTFEREFGKA